MKRYADGVDQNLNSKFQAIAGQRTDHVLQVTNPARQLQPSGLTRSMTPQRSAMTSLQTGTPLSSYYPFSGSNVLDGLRTQNTSGAVPLPIPADKLETNDKQSVNRLIMPHTDSLDSAAVHELVFEYKSGPNRMTTTTSVHGQPLQGMPLEVVNPAIYNHTILQQQLVDAQIDYDAYCLKTPYDYWEDWTVGGVVEFERMADGAESGTTSGFSSTSRYQHACGYKRTTNTSKGPEYIYNYFGDNIKPGGKCYAIIKKHAMPTEFVLGSKINPASIAAVRQISTGLVQVNNAPKLVRPYQMSFVCLPDGGLMPSEALCYLNEAGEVKRDGLLIYLGTIFSVPIYHKYRHITNYNHVESTVHRIPDRKEQHAFSNSNEGIMRESVMLTRLIMDSNDGIGVI